MKRRTLTVMLGLLMALTAAAGWGQASYLWAPPAFDLYLRPGETTEIEMNLVNQGTEPATFTFELADIKAKPKGKGYKFTTPDPTNPYSCAEWMTLEPTAITLQAQKGCTVKATIKVPRGAKGARYVAVLCRLDVEKPSERVAGRVELQWYMTTVVSLTIAGTRMPKTAEVVNLEVTKPKRSQGALAIRARLKNTSQVHVFAQGRLTLRDGEGRRIRECPLGQGRGMILPGAEMEFTSIFRQQFLPGDYIADVAIDYGGNRGPARASLPFTVTRESLTSQEMIHQVAFYATPQFRTLEVSPGAVRGISVQLTNRENVPVHVQTALRDIQFDQFGRLVVLDTRDGENSAAPWVTVEPTELDLKPHEQRTLRYRISVPRDFDGGGAYACLVFTASVKEAGNQPKQSQATTALLISVPRNAKRLAKITDISITQNKVTKLNMIGVTLQNDGNIHLIPLEGHVVISKRAEKATPEPGSGIEIMPSERERYEQIATLPLQNISTILLPGASRVFVAVGRGVLPSGQYRADAVINYGGDSPALFSQEFTIEADEADNGAAQQASIAGIESEEGK